MNNQILEKSFSSYTRNMVKKRSISQKGKLYSIFWYFGQITLRELFFPGINFCGALIWDFLRNLILRIFDSREIQRFCKIFSNFSRLKNLVGTLRFGVKSARTTKFNFRYLSQKTKNAKFGHIFNILEASSQNLTMYMSLNPISPD